MKNNAKNNVLTMVNGNETEVKTEVERISDIDRKRQPYAGTQKTKAQKKDYIDVLMKVSRFNELKFSREFSEFMLSQFVAEAATKCLEIKTKYNLFGKSLKPEKAVDISLLEGLLIDVEPKNSHGRKECWVAKTDDGDVVLWVSPTLSVKDGQALLMDALAMFLLTDYHDLYFNGEDFGSLEETLKNPPRLKAILVAETLHAMLRSNESKAELIALQSVTKRGALKEKAKTVPVVTRPKMPTQPRATRKTLKAAA